MALKNMKGDYFCFLDSDDNLPHNSLKSRLEIFRKSDDIEFVDGSVEIWDKNFSKLLKFKRHEFIGNPLNSLVKLDGKTFFGPSWMIRRITNKSYYFDSNLTHGEDLLFYISIGQSGIYSSTRDVTYKYRNRKDSAMSNLRGIEKGYAYIENYISQHLSDGETMASFFGRKTRLIMIKSYVKNLNISRAVKVAFKGCK